MSRGEELLAGRLYRLSRTSDGLALWIPGKIVRKLGLKPGQLVLIVPHGNSIELIPLDKLLEDMKPVEVGATEPE